jgi:hypothetical protein
MPTYEKGQTDQALDFVAQFTSIEDGQFLSVDVDDSTMTDEEKAELDTIMAGLGLSKKN